MNNQQLAADILKEIGGKANIESVTHCVTRLRFVLHDTDIPDSSIIVITILTKREERFIDLLPS